MALVELIMPKMGESIMEATVLSWLKKEGDPIEQDESVLEVATDKVDTEVPSTHAGVLKEILAKDGDVVEVGKPIAIIATDGEDTSSSGQPAKEEKVAEKQPAMAEAVGTSAHASNGVVKLEEPVSGRFYSPLVKNIAKEEGIPMAELETVPGSGKEGRVTKKDILSYLETRGSQPAPQAPPQATQQVSTPVQERPVQKVNVSISAGDEIIEMDRMRKMISERMVDSKRISPHVTSFVEADVTNIVFWRNRKKNEFKQREGDNLTFTPIFVEAVVKAIKDYPMINVQVDGDRIIKKKDINIGMAVALPSGNLIVPVIRNADQYNLTGLAKKVNDLAKRARENKLTPDELSGGTFTVSNVGSFGNVMGTPIIMQPQVGILALGAIVKKPAVIETPQGDTIGIRHKMFLSHSYDHRVVDGSLGGMVVRRVADYLEKFDLDRSL
ncbi:Dihydrolipoamide acyltransferase component of branched-chain alpha-keto acid dehydrogenase complex [Fulvivirga imtechensis AK7]|uniref:Dihydrolipoamide acetyltransferase component of pyruvate dehydrogenase complex n=1 Tax=Fulvivirga imtechensis AK7 TaxID=1237149 RepID=L8K257_9BACT|nr:dihydrolipoamide acetyltransferase family protein [Fulvivirga imtechensis]ELR73537.1 Dihydrolipoamide acyltransferase component of branched-chain alpha-keto acid dehydrogenase complex [Fulvivirga imtechensis AK7]